MAHWSHISPTVSYRIGERPWRSSNSQQDFAAGEAEKDKGDTFKIQYWMYAATGGPNMKWGVQILNGGPCTTATPLEYCSNSRLKLPDILVAKPKQGVWLSPL